MVPAQTLISLSCDQHDTEDPSSAAAGVALAVAPSDEGAGAAAGVSYDDVPGSGYEHDDHDVGVGVDISESDLPVGDAGASVPSYPPGSENDGQGPQTGEALAAASAQVVRQPSSADCVVCLTAPRSTRFQPCGHAVCCLGCATTIRDSNDSKCPLCRGNFYRIGPMGPSTVTCDGQVRASRVMTAQFWMVMKTTLLPACVCSPNPIVLSFAGCFSGSLPEYSPDRPQGCLQAGGRSWNSETAAGRHVG
jgi:hypothetical protein